MCKTSNGSQSYNNSIPTVPYHLLAKLSTTINGEGVMCSKTKLIITTHTTFFGNTFSDRNLEPQNVSAQECHEMVQTKMCVKNRMNCVESGACKYNGEPQVTYSWMASMAFDTFHCTISNKRLLSNRADLKILSDSSSSCRAQDLFCQIGNNVVIWNTKIVNVCPYEYIQQADFYNLSNIFVSEKSAIVLQYVAKVNECQMNLLQTAEGLFLTEDPKALGLVDHTNSTAHEFSYFKFAMADANFHQFESRNNLFSYLKDILCVSYKTQLSIRRNFESDEFYPLFDFTNILVLQNVDGLITVPDCYKVNEIEVFNKSKTCNRGISISFTLQGNLHYGFLNKDRIISQTTAIRNCSKTFSMYFVEQGLIVKSVENYYLFQDHSGTNDSSIKHLPPKSYNFDHNQILLDHVSEFTDIEKQAEIIDFDNAFLEMLEDNELKTSIYNQKKKIVVENTDNILTEAITKTFNLSWMTKSYQILSEVCFFVIILVLLCIALYLRGAIYKCFAAILNLLMAILRGKRSSDKIQV
jgi:hypothetical protein